MIAGSFDVLAGQVIRIGHMGENAAEADVKETLQALKKYWNRKLTTGFPVCFLSNHGKWCKMHILAVCAAHRRICVRRH